MLISNLILDAINYRKKASDYSNKNAYACIYAYTYAFIEACCLLQAELLTISDICLAIACHHTISPMVFSTQGYHSFHPIPFHLA